MREAKDALKQDLDHCEEQLRKNNQDHAFELGKQKKLHATLECDKTTLRDESDRRDFELSALRKAHESFLDRIMQRLWAIPVITYEIDSQDGDLFLRLDMEAGEVHCLILNRDPTYRIRQYAIPECCYRFHGYAIELRLGVIDLLLCYPEEQVMKQKAVRIRKETINKD